MLYLVGNPAVAVKVLDINIRATLLVPFRVALYVMNEEDGAHIVYDLPSSLFANIRQPELTEIGESLDEKIETVIGRVLDAGG